MMCSISVSRYIGSRFDWLIIWGCTQLHLSSFVRVCCRLIIVIMVVGAILVIAVNLYQGLQVVFCFLDLIILKSSLYVGFSYI